MNRFLSLVVLSGLILIVGVPLDGATSLVRSSAPENKGEENDKKSSNIATPQNVTSLGQFTNDAKENKEKSNHQGNLDKEVVFKYASMTNEEFAEKFLGLS